MDPKEKAFAEQLAVEISLNEDTIRDIFHRSTIGQCGKCKGFQQENLHDLCPECLRALEEMSDEIFSSSPMLQRFADVMNTRS